MAAFCSCCGAEITLKAEACPVCGTPRHGMPKPDPPPGLGVTDQSEDGEEREEFSDKYACARKR